MNTSILIICYIIGSVSFILGLKMLSNPLMARKGNLIAAGGMAIAIIGTIFLYETEEGKRLGNFAWIFGGILIGSVIGTMAAKRVKMTAMPELVSLFNGMGGACAALISIVEYNHIFVANKNLDTTSIADLVPAGHYFAIIAGAIIGSVSFAGSVIAWGKLNGKIKDFSFNGQHIVNLLTLALAIAAAIFTYNSEVHFSYIPFLITIALALVYGIFLCCRSVVLICQW